MLTKDTAAAHLKQAEAQRMQDEAQKRLLGFYKAAAPSLKQPKVSHSPPKHFPTQELSARATILDSQLS
jgi:hypothetical protein